METRTRIDGAYLSGNALVGNFCTDSFIAMHKDIFSVGLERRPVGSINLSAHAGNNL